MPELTEIQSLKADLWKAKHQIVQLRAALANCETRLNQELLAREQRRLESDFLSAHDAEPDAQWDWDQMKPAG